MKRLILILFLLLVSCDSEPQSTRVSPIKGEYIYRYRNDNEFQIDPMARVRKPTYPWADGREGNIPRITKDFFRCKGCILNPVHIVAKEKEAVRYYDCGGSQKHSLPLRDNKEFVYPILIDILNYIQEMTGKKVVITCGHCCPEHNLYLDPSIANQASKHMLAAEVDFYVQGLEQHPDKVIEIILGYYSDKSKYKGLKDYQFLRYDKDDKMNVSTKPWYNKEIFIKLYKKNEGRDLDNRHNYPYICIQVRYDEELKQRVNYNWKQAQNYQRF